MKKIMLSIIPSTLLEKAPIQFTDQIKSIFNLPSTSDISSTTKEFSISKEKGFLTTFYTQNKLLGSVLFNSSVSIANIQAVYKGMNETDLIHLYQGNKNESLTNEEQSIDSIVQSTYSVSTNSKAKSIVPTDSSSYFSVNKTYYFEREVNHYTEYSKIRHVPNYMNTMFNHKGCVPTTAAMYFSFLGNSSYDRKNILEEPLPLSHTEDEEAVNRFITLLGENYFKTTSLRGTFEEYIAPGYTYYLNEHGYHNYETTMTRNLTAYQEVITKTANPVPLSANPCDIWKAFHSILGIGYRRLPTTSGIKELIIVNAAYEDKMEEIEVDASYIDQYFFIHKK